MDGVADISQKPIPPGPEFIYEYSHANGTHWYHSHTGVQYGNGLLARSSSRTRPIAKYDREEVYTDP